MVITNKKLADENNKLKTYIKYQNKKQINKENNEKANKLNKQIKEIESWKNEYDKIFHENILLKNKIIRFEKEKKLFNC